MKRALALVLLCAGLAVAEPSLPPPQVLAPTYSPSPSPGVDHILQLLVRKVRREVWTPAPPPSPGWTRIL